MADVTQILSQFEHGDPSAGEQLLRLVYDELRRLAAAKLALEKPGQTLQPTALVHEAYLRLVGGTTDPEWENRRHFFAAAAEAMRRILIDRARQKSTTKHGGEFRRIELDEQLIVDERATSNLLALDEALAELESHDSNAAKLVNLRYFAGLNHQDAAAAMQISRRQADRLWTLAKAWLYNRLATGD